MSTGKGEGKNRKGGKRESGVEGRRVITLTRHPSSYKAGPATMTSRALLDVWRELARGEEKNSIRRDLPQ